MVSLRETIRMGKRLREECARVRLAATTPLYPVRAIAGADRETVGVGPGFAGVAQLALPAVEIILG